MLEFYVHLKKNELKITDWILAVKLLKEKFYIMATESNNLHKGITVKEGSKWEVTGLHFWPQLLKQRTWSIIISPGVSVSPETFFPLHQFSAPKQLQSITETQFRIFLAG